MVWMQVMCGMRLKILDTTLSGVKRVWCEKRVSAQECVRESKAKGSGIRARQSQRATWRQRERREQRKTREMSAPSRLSDRQMVTGARCQEMGLHVVLLTSANQTINQPAKFDFLFLARCLSSTRPSSRATQHQSRLFRCPRRHMFCLLPRCRRTMRHPHQRRRMASISSTNQIFGQSRSSQATMTL